MEHPRFAFTPAGKKSYKKKVRPHGTYTLITASKIQHYGFKRSTKGNLGAGVYVTWSFEKASTYPTELPPGQKCVVLRLSVRVGKAKHIDKKGDPLQKKWREAGYDTTSIPPNCDVASKGLEENCVWDPKRIRVLKVLETESSLSEDSEESTVVDRKPSAKPDKKPFSGVLI